MNNFKAALFFSIVFLATMTPQEAGAQAVNTDYGMLVRIPAFHSKYVKPRNVDIWLPKGYDESAEKYTVLYMHDGQNLFFRKESTWDKTWRVDSTFSELMEKGEIVRCIVVGIWNTDKRSSEYTPQKPAATLPDTLKKKMNAENGEMPFSDNYLRFIVEELKPFIDAHYRVFTDRAHTLVMGSSKGGLISMYAALEYPEVFSAAGCVSTHWPGLLKVNEPLIARAFAEYIASRLKEVRNVKFYFDYGTETLDAQYEPDQRAVDSVFAAAGYPAELRTTKKFEGASHEEHSWAQRLSVPAMFLLGK